LVFELWNSRKIQDFIDSNVYYLKNVQQSQLGTIKHNTDGSLSSTERQWLQIEKLKANDPLPYVDINGLRQEFGKLTYPLHFIDFETTMVAIPFYRGRKPYEQIAFQYSHHIVTADLRIEHAGEFLSEKKGEFPNFEFVRYLKESLEHDNGTIFRYAAHENTVLNQILVQLNEASTSEVHDKKELIEFIKTITKGANHSGERNMVDLKDLVVKYYYHPLTKGSNSLKAILPAILASSEFLQDKYSKPIYGKNSLIKSKNYPDGWIWIKKDCGGNIINPYKLIPPLYENICEDLKKNFLMIGDIREGGAAMTAFGLMQFAKISDVEREAIANGLLKYCELDTMAMVMIWEYWNDLIRKY
jgi:hypothetical protein